MVHGKGSQMKKLLVILPWFPYPLNSGGNQAIVNGIKALSRDFEVVVLYIDYTPLCHKQSRESLKKELGTVKLVCFWDYKILLSEIKRRILGTHFDYKYMDLLKFRRYPKSLSRKVNELVCENKIDCVQIEMFDAISLIKDLPKRVKKIFVHHEIRYILGKQLISLCKNKEAFVKKLEREKRFEIEYLNKFDKVVTLSNEDKNQLVLDGLTTSCASSLAVVKTTVCDGISNPLFENKLTFVGPEQHLPNKNGLLWFLDNCWRDLSKNGNLTLDVIGCWSEETKLCVASKYRNVIFHGFVDDLYAALKGSIMVVPIFEGSGIRMKILEAAQLGIPFISTTVGCMGLPFEHGKHCLIADSSDAFKVALDTLDDSEKRNRLARNAFSLVREQYSLETLRCSRVEIISSLLN